MIYHMQIKESTTGVMLREASNTFHVGLDKEEANLPAQSLTWFGTEEFSSPLLTVNSLLKDSCQTDLTYKINGCYIHTNFEEGTLVVAYKAFPMDADGAPLIPDNVKYILAVKHYIAEKIAQKLWIKGKLTGDKFQWFQRERDWYIGAATTAAHTPTMDQMETWKNQFLRLIPKVNAHADAFKSLGQGEKRKTHNSI